MKKEFKKVLMVTSLVVLVFGFTACGSTDDKNNSGNNTISNVVKDVNLETAKAVMLGDIKNYSFVVETEMMGFETTITGKEDVENKISYSSFGEMDMLTETYLDYENSYQYIKVSSAGLPGLWMKSEYLESDESSEYLGYVDMIGLMGNPEVVNEANGTRYTSTVDLSQFDNSTEEENVVDMDLFDENTIIEVFVNSDNTIGSIEMNTVSNGSDVKFKISFSDVNTSGSIEIPEEAINVSDIMSLGSDIMSLFE